MKESGMDFSGCSSCQDILIKWRHEEEFCQETFNFILRGDLRLSRGLNIPFGRLHAHRSRPNQGLKKRPHLRTYKAALKAALKNPYGRT